MNVNTATAVQGNKMTFSIDKENNITAFGTEPEACEGEKFSSQKELTNLAANWPSARLVEVWNSIPGLAPMKKFTDRKSAVSRIWKAIQSLTNDSRTEATSAAPKAAKKADRSPKLAKETKRVVKAKPAKAAKGKRAKGGATPAARDGSKKAVVLGLLQRKGGATLAQIMNATG